MKLNIKGSLLVVLLLWGSILQAGVTDRLSMIIEKELEAISVGLNDNDFFKAQTYQSHVNFTGFEIWMATSIGIEVPFLASLEIVPEIEMIWAKVNE